MRRILAVVTAIAMTMPWVADAAEPIIATLYKTPLCDCCDGHADHLRAEDFRVNVIERHDLPLLKRQLGVKPALDGCHTITVGGYVVEGHVSATTIKRLLAERPPIRGISMPGMPEGSPGMSGVKSSPFVIYEITTGPDRVYAVE